MSGDKIQDILEVVVRDSETVSLHLLLFLR